MYEVNEIWPIVVPSYKRGSKAKTLQLLKNGYDPRLKYFLFIYPDDKDNYSEIINSGHFEVVYCEGFRGIVPKRNFINETLYSRGYENIFVLDDDISGLYDLVPGVQKKDPSKYKSVKVNTKPYDFFKKLQGIIMNADKHLTQTGLINEMGATFNTFEGKNPVHYYSIPIQLMHICIKDIIDHDIKFRTGHGWDDFDFSMQILSKGFDIGHVICLTYTSDTMEPDGGVANTGADKWTRLSMELYKTWGDSIKLFEKKGQVNGRPQARIIRKKREKGISLTEKYYEDCYRDIILNDDVQALKKLIVEDGHKGSRSCNFDWENTPSDFVECGPIL